ncbi:hypothetical protein TNCV_2624841 [Trichonephila clavipes]|nr:hypothetical protein TNCV_2624841 [Trichonephila clavipes]
MVAKMIANMPNWSQKMTPTWLCRQVPIESTLYLPQNDFKTIPKGKKGEYLLSGELKVMSKKLYPQNSRIVRVHYFVRGGFVGHRSRASSKHLSPHLPVGSLDSSGGQTGVALHLKLHVWASDLQRNRPDVVVFEK